MKKVLPVILVLVLLCTACGAPKGPTVAATIEAVHEDGTVYLKSTTLTLEEGSTVIDLLRAAAKEQKVAVATNGTAPNRYVEGIGGLFAGDEGDLSGWLYFINGEPAAVGADQTPVRLSDSYCFFYVKDYTTVPF